MGHTRLEQAKDLKEFTKNTARRLHNHLKNVIAAMGKRKPYAEVFKVQTRVF